MNNVLLIDTNWESDICEVQIEPDTNDPLGFRAVFYLTDASAKAREVAFRIGASNLANRAKSLAVAGFKAPMTRKAMALIESRTGLPARA
jgi:hypothetical protein